MVRVRIQTRHGSPRAAGGWISVLASTVSTAAARSISRWTRATTLFVYAVYEQIFMNLSVGKASALAVVYFLVLCVLAALQLRAWRSQTPGTRGAG